MTEDRGVMIQYFHWYTENDGKLWKNLAKKASELAKVGFTAVWLPPAYKGNGGGFDTGYGVYDMYDLGEFDQKGTVRTKYGTKEEYIAAIKALKKEKINSYADIVFNHRIGADESEIVKATPYPQNNRLEPMGQTYEIEAQTHFYFPGRKGSYSNFEWHWWHFDAIDRDSRNPNESSTIYLFEGKNFDDSVSTDYGNYDYLMGCDLDFQNEEVQKELITWGKWYIKTTGIDGFRLDAVKHIPSWFFKNWLTEMSAFSGKDVFSVGEFWDPNVQLLQSYLDNSGGTTHLFDVPLHYNFHRASKSGNNYNLRTIFDNTLVKASPRFAVTFVANHDSQALQALESVVEPWFKPLAYALILLRTEGYPCVFYTDYYGAEYTDNGRDGNKYSISMPSHKDLIDQFIYARKIGTFGEQRDYFDHDNTIGWTFSGEDQHPRAMAVLMTNGSDGTKAMDTGKPNTTFLNIADKTEAPVITDANGVGEFHCHERSVSVWLSK